MTNRNLTSSLSDLVKRILEQERLAISTVHAMLDRHGLVQRRNRATGTPLSQVAAPNELQCAFYTGESCWPTGATVIR